MFNFKVVLRGENNINGTFTSLEAIKDYWYTCKFDSIGYTKVHMELTVNELTYKCRLDMTENEHLNNYFNFFSVLRNHIKDFYNFYYNNKENFKNYQCKAEDKLILENISIPLVEYLYLISTKENNYQPVKYNRFYQITITKDNKELLSYYTLDVNEAINANIRVYKIDNNIDLTAENFNVKTYQLTKDNIICLLGKVKF